MFIKHYKNWCDLQRVTDMLNHYKVSFELNIDNNGHGYIRINSITPGNIHAVAAAMLPHKHIDHPSFGSDLYIKVTDQSREIVDHLTPKILLSQFTDNIENTRWYDLPFCYNPAIRTGV